MVLFRSNANSEYMHLGSGYDINVLFALYKLIVITLFVQENGQVAERCANEHFERLFETLQERKSEMLKSIEQSRSRRLDQLKSQVWTKKK